MKKHWFHILLVVAEAARVHGAEIQRRVGDQTEGAVRLYPVTLYRALDDLSERGLIREVSAPSEADHNEKRRYYSITSAGRAALAAEAEALETAAHLARAALQRGRA